MDLTAIARQLSDELQRLRFGPPVACVYNPLDYAWEAYAAYLERYGGGRREVVLVGMNPGPWGMVQTGVPFGEVNLVRDWLGIKAAVGKPKRQHPKRPVDGFACRRSEVSGARIWGWARDTFGTPQRFFARFFIANYCPLAFFDESGRNMTPDRLPPEHRDNIMAPCDHALCETVAYFKPRFVIGIGRFAEKRARMALAGLDVTVGHILHPSPASPAANKNWPGKIMVQLAKYGIALPEHCFGPGRR